MAANMKMIHEPMPEDADFKEKFPRVPPNERSEFVQYLMRRATWCVGVSMCNGIIFGVFDGLHSAGF